MAINRNIAPLAITGERSGSVPTLGASDRAGVEGDEQCSVDPSRPVVLRPVDTHQVDCLLARHDASIRVCSVAQCGRKINARGLCMTHYSRFRRSGLADPSEMPVGRPIGPPQGGDLAWPWITPMGGPGYEMSERGVPVGLPPMADDDETVDLSPDCDCTARVGHHRGCIALENRDEAAAQADAYEMSRGDR